MELRLIGMTGREIAETLDVTASAVKTARYRAIARLRDLLADDEKNGTSR